MTITHEESAGDTALNTENLTVGAWDRVRVPDTDKSIDRRYFCWCGCGSPVILHRGKIRSAHFAYCASERLPCIKGSGGGGGPETMSHYNAKWWLYDNFHTVTIRDMCPRGHVIETHTFESLEWIAFVEKGIPNTNCIADVLLQNTSTGVFVALEVYETHRVPLTKRDKCRDAGVCVLEVLAREVNAVGEAIAGELVRVFDNLILVGDDEDECHECRECAEIVEKQAITDAANERKRAREYAENDRKRAREYAENDRKRAREYAENERFRARIQECQRQQDNEQLCIEREERVEIECEGVVEREHGRRYKRYREVTEDAIMRPPSLFWHKFAASVHA
ncbi:hypothetical protein T484DRAFT_1757474 [Baffinella frigidus]|nr:hypothetical protein T484DRAFT_1757474 [Cryptophyta sp. CCMP2293]